jgi:hypothetical protein
MREGLKVRSTAASDDLLISRSTDMIEDLVAAT